MSRYANTNDLASRVHNHCDITQKMHFKSEKYINKKRKKDSQLKEEDKIYLLMKNLTTKRLIKKLNHVKIESFFIKAIKKPVNHELNLSKNIRIHSIFYINLLKPADLNIFIQKDFYFEDSKEKYIVKEILKKKDLKNLIK